MPTITDARQAVRERMEAGGIVDRDDAAVPMRWPNEGVDSAGNAKLPDAPAPFIYTEFNPVAGNLASFGGGRGQNRYRNQFQIECFVFVPKGDGLDHAEMIAEQVAALFRSHRDDEISCFAATVRPGGDGAMLSPPGLTSEAGRYFWASVEIEGFYDQIG